MVFNAKSERFFSILQTQFSLFFLFRRHCYSNHQSPITDFLLTDVILIVSDAYLNTT